MVNIIGRSKALYLLGTGKVISANECLTINLVDDICPQNSDCDNKAKEFLMPFLNQKYPCAVRGIKEVIAQMDDSQGEDNRSKERVLFVKRWFSSENKEALSRK